jgi:hypothetical protein
MDPHPAHDAQHGAVSSNRGAFATEEAALGELLRRLTTTFHPQEVRLFGSRSEGRGAPDSDFDLVVVLDDDAPEELLDPDVIYRPLVGSGIGCDVIACRRGEFEAVLRDPANPWRRAWEHARVVHARA